MEDQGRGTKSIAGLVEGYLAGEMDDITGPSSSVSDPHGAWRVRSVLLLLDQCFPEGLVHKVLWCSEKDAREMIDAIRQHLPDADKVRDFLRKKDGKKSSSSRVREDTSMRLDTEDVKQALNMLEYWTDHWLQEYKGKG